MDVEEVSDGVTSETRREALKRFARYAAAAPTVMVLLQPSEGHAARRRYGRPRPGGNY